MQDRTGWIPHILTSRLAPLARARRGGGGRSAGEQPYRKVELRSKLCEPVTTCAIKAIVLTNGGGGGRKEDGNGALSTFLLPVERSSCKCYAGKPTACLPPLSTPCPSPLRPARYILRRKSKKCVYIPNLSVCDHIVSCSRTAPLPPHPARPMLHYTSNRNDCSQALSCVPLNQSRTWVEIGGGGASHWGHSPPSSLGRMYIRATTFPDRKQTTCSERFRSETCVCRCRGHPTKEETAMRVGK